MTSPSKERRSRLDTARRGSQAPHNRVLHFRDGQNTEGTEPPRLASDAAVDLIPAHPSRLAIGCRGTLQGGGVLLKLQLGNLAAG